MSDFERLVYLLKTGEDDEEMMELLKYTDSDTRYKFLILCNYIVEDKQVLH